MKIAEVMTKSQAFLGHSVHTQYLRNGTLFTARSELHKLLFLALSVTFLFAYEISREPLNGFGPNSQGRRARSLAWTSLNVKVKTQWSRSPGQKRHFSALSAACARFMSAKTSLAYSYICSSCE